MRASESREQLDDHCENAKSGCFSWSRGGFIVLNNICMMIWREFVWWMNPVPEPYLLWKEVFIGGFMIFMTLNCGLFLDLSWGKFYPNCSFLFIVMEMLEFLSVASTPKSHLTFLRSKTRGKVWCSMHSNLHKHKHHIETLESSRVHPQKICVIHIYNPNLLKSIHNNNHMTSRC